MLCRKNGIALLYAILFIGVVMTLTLLTQSIVLKLIVSGRDEQRGVYAYHAADAAEACIRYLDGYFYARNDPTNADKTGGFLRHTGEGAYCYGLNASAVNVEVLPQCSTDDIYCALLLVPSPKSILDTNNRCAIVKMRKTPGNELAGSQDIFGADLCGNGTTGSLLQRIKKTDYTPVLRILFRRS